jgi:methylenetetrahydrofolate dehydrogenase (NADP+)/methenyltetrahydrofolate cyclohydrolase
MAMLLLNRHATVTVCHSRTERLQVVCHSADILVAAVGKAEMIQGSWIRPGSVVIDVGINRMDVEGMTKQKLVGDVAFMEASQRASLITPVPGGVGPMTIAMLLKNTLQSAEWRANPHP